MSHDESGLILTCALSLCPLVHCSLFLFLSLEFPECCKQSRLYYIYYSGLNLIAMPDLDQTRGYYHTSPLHLFNLFTHPSPHW